MRKSNTPEDRLLPYETIAAAAAGDPDAMAAVLQHFEGYINYMSVRSFKSESGQSCDAVDYELKERIKSRMIEAIIKRFKPF